MLRSREAAGVSGPVFVSRAAHLPLSMSPAPWRLMSGLREPAGVSGDMLVCREASAPAPNSSQLWTV
jgi:hypothetical protein